MVCVGVCVLLVVCVRYRDPVQQSLQVLQQLRETQRSLQEALQHAGEFSQHADAWENCGLYTKDGSRHCEGHPDYFCNFFMNASREVEIQKSQHGGARLAVGGVTVDVSYRLEFFIDFSKFDWRREFTEQKTLSAESLGERRRTAEDDQLRVKVRTSGGSSGVHTC